MQGTEYSPYKCLFHLDALDADRPVLCYWLITHRCVYKCPVCINDHMEHMRRDDELSLEAALDYGKQMLDLGVKALSISGGEPLLHRDFNKLMSGLLDMGFDIGMISNGILLDRVDIDLIKHFKWFRVSVNSMSEESFEEVHGVKSNHFKSNIWDVMGRNLARLKSDGCIVGSSFLVQEANAREIYPFAVWSKEVGFDTCRYSYVRTPDGIIHYDDDFKFRVIHFTQKAKSLESDSFKVFELSDRMSISREKAYEHCYISDLSFNICANRNVYRCCSLQNTDMGYLGSLKDKNLAEIWKGRGSQDVSKCPMCWQVKKNEVLEYMRSEDRVHINFV